jgi:pimeloyl-ACP methyl ester carboxylesterase
MGGLISLYAGLKRPDIYGRVGVFSPSVWFAPQIWDSLSTAPFDPNQRYYILAGGREGSNLPADAQRLEQALMAKGHTNISVHREFDPNGSHTEAFWAAWFGDAYQWLFSPVTGLNTLSEAQFRPFPNPLVDTLRVEYPGEYEIELFSPEGKLILKQQADYDHLISFDHLSSGPHLLKVHQEGKSLSRVIWKK